MARRGLPMLAGLAALIAALAFAFRQAPHPDPMRVAPAWSPAWLLHPLERNPWRRLPAVIADLNDVHASAGGRLWVVGDGATILHSPDRGRTWVRQSAPELQEPTELAALEPPDEEPTSKAGRSSSSMAQEAGDARQQSAQAAREEPSWGTSLEAPRARAPGHLADVAFHADERRGWIVGARGAILVTTDGGASWDAVASGTGAALSSVAFAPDGLRGWAVGERGTILSSADGGRSWRAGRRFTNDWLRCIALGPDPVHAWVVGSEGGMWSTQRADDAGATWVTTSSYGSLSSIAIHPSSASDIVVAGWGRLARFDGNRFSAADAEPESQINRVMFGPDGVRAYAVGESGTLLVSDDRGLIWESRATSDHSLKGVAFSDREHGWAVGRGGTIVCSDDGGNNWVAATRGALPALRSVWIEPDGAVAAALGDERVLFTRREAGGAWEALGSDPDVVSDARFAEGDGEPRSGGAWGGREIHSVAFAADRTRGVAVGSGVTILETEDGGASWSEPPYRRYPAPWSWLAVPLLAAGTVAVARRKPKPVVAEKPSVADLLASDRPLEGDDRDVLDFARRASGVVRFLANDRTEPPLTLAITGEWGSGKSSLMNLVRRGLAAYDFRTIWFNAWHHQTEEHLLAALNEALKRDGTPPWHTLDGLGFRARLLFRRGWRNCVPVAALAIVLGAVIGFLAGGERYASALDGLRRMMKLQPPASLPQGGQVLALLFTLLAPLIALLRGLSTFASSTSGVGSRLFGRLRFDAAGLTPGLRHRFAEHFHDVTEALAPRRLVLFIDDLDRCQPENVVRVLELVNFLVSSGKCYVVLGIAPEWVASAVGLGFKEVADEWAALEAVKAAAPPTARNGKEAPQGASAAATRREFALKYLSKLVNIEVPVPPISQDQARELLGDLAREVSAEARRPEGRIWQRWLRPFAPLGFFASLVLLAYFVPRAVLALVPPAEPTAQDVVVDLAERLHLPTTGPAPHASGEAREPSTSDVAPDPAAAPAPTSFEVGAIHELPTWPVVVLVSLVAAWALRELARAPLPLETDSVDFRNALDRWAPLVYRANPSPRSVKRYLNRVRYMAMCQRHPFPERARRTWRLFGRHPAESPTAPAAARIPDADLVGLAALHHALHADFHEAELWESVGSFLVKKALPVPWLSGNPDTAFDELDRLGRHRTDFDQLSRGISIRV